MSEDLLLDRRLCLAHVHWSSGSGEQARVDRGCRHASAKAPFSCQAHLADARGLPSRLEGSDHRPMELPVAKAARRGRQRARFSPPIRVAARRERRQGGPRRRPTATARYSNSATE